MTGLGILSDAEQREGGGTETGRALGRRGDGGHRERGGLRSRGDAKEQE